MDAFSRPQCLPNTRQDTLKFITDWLTTPSHNENILWLRDIAGSGKSTISNTVAGYFRDLERLGAFVFFDRNNATSRDPATVIRTLSYELADFDPSMQAAVSAQLERDFGITEASVHLQFTKLILDPLASVTTLSTCGPIIIILDALDECGDPASRKDLLLLLAQEFVKLPPPVRVLITSRDEPDIAAALSGKQNIVINTLSQMDHSAVADVSLYLRHHIAVFRLDKALELAPEWPGEHKVQALIDHSGGLFIWASTAVRFIADGLYPEVRLNSLLDSQNDRQSESALDALYATALNMAGEWNSDEFADDFRAVLGAIVVAKMSLTDSTLDRILGLDGRRPSHMFVSRLRCFLQWSTGQPIQILHASFVDYLSDKSRCGSHPWFVDVPLHNQILATACFRHMQVGLRCNICELETSHIFNDDVSDLHDRTEKFIVPHLSYACHFWAHHLQLSASHSATLAYIENFLRLQLLYWLEVLSLIGKLSIALWALTYVARIIVGDISIFHVPARCGIDTHT
jgi:hypothetical protein